MAIDKVNKSVYKEEVENLKPEINAIQQRTKELISKKLKNPNLKGYYNIELVVNYMALIRLNLKQNDLCLELLKIKSDTAQTSARKTFSLIIQTLEETVGNDVDRTLLANDEYLAHIDRFTPAQILSLIQQLYSLLDEIKLKVGGIGETDSDGKVKSGGSKWRWLMVDFQGRLAIITKNITSFSDIARLRDPRTPFYRERRALMSLCITNLEDAAREFRTKYELGGRVKEDIKRIIEFLEAEKKIHALFGHSGEVARLKKLIEANSEVLNEEDEKVSKTAVKTKRRKLSFGK